MDLMTYYWKRKDVVTSPSGYRPASAFPKSWMVIKAELKPGNSDILYELSFKHGRVINRFPFTFPRPPSLELTFPVANAWQNENTASRQLYCRSTRTPRLRNFPSRTSETHVSDYVKRSAASRAVSAPVFRSFHQHSHDSAPGQKNLFPTVAQRNTQDHTHHKIHENTHLLNIKQFNVESTK